MIKLLWYSRSTTCTIFLLMVYLFFILQPEYNGSFANPNEDPELKKKQIIENIANFTFPLKEFRELKRKFPHQFLPQYYNPRNINLGWVINSDPHFIQMYANQISSIACYCSLYNIHLYIDPVLTVLESEDNRDYNQVKIRNVMKYLQFHDWLFVSDADHVVLNYTAPIYQYLTNDTDDYDVIFSEREFTLEVMAGSYFIKNSDPGWEFLHKWYRLYPNGWNYNSDNGDLQELLRQYMINDFTDHACFKDRHQRRYSKQFVHCCMKEMVAHSHSDTWKNNPIYYGFPAPHNYIKMYRSMMGFFRLVGLQEECERFKFPSWCYYLPGDFLGHGKKLDPLIDRAFLQCDLRKMVNLANTSTITKERIEILMTPFDRWKSVEQSQQIAKNTLFHRMKSCPCYTSEHKDCGHQNSTNC